MSHSASDPAAATASSTAHGLPLFHPGDADSAHQASASMTPPALAKGNSALEPVAADIHSSSEQHATLDPTPPSENVDSKFFSTKTFMIALPNIIIPVLYGYHIGLVGVYSTLYKWATDCEMYGAQTPCETLSNAKCKWAYVEQLPGETTGGYMCQWTDRMTCSLHYYYDEAACDADSTCQWNYNDGHCANEVGYKSIMSGLFAGSMIIGAMFGSMFGGAMTKKLNFRLSFLIIGIISTVAAVLTHVTTGIFEYWLLFVARIIVGFPMGWQAVASPAYVAAFSAKNHQKTLGTLFQVFTAFGSFVSAIVGLGVGQSIKFNSNKDANLMGRMQGFVSLPTLLSVLVMGLYFVARDLPTEQTAEEVAEIDSAAKGSDVEPAAPSGKPNEAAKEYTVMQMLGPIAMGFCMACTLQLTGINAMMNYAPTIMSNLGLQPLVGNIIVIGWNSVTAFGVIPLSRYFRMRTLFLVFTLAGSIACLFLCGIPVYPGVTPDKSAKDGIAITGIALFILSYEFGIGPCFFVLAADVFPASFRPLGASLTVMFQFIFNLIINICYPIATEGISGGPGGDQDKGQAVAFIFFGCIGFVTVVAEFFCLHPWDKAEKPMNAEGLDEVEDAQEA